MKSLCMKITGIILIFLSYIQIDCAIAGAKEDVRDNLMWAAVMNMGAVALIARSLDIQEKR